MYQITFLHHSSILIETSHTFLLFDYDNNIPGHLFDIKKFTKKPLYVFVSHAHSDHYDPIVFQWSKIIPKIHYILSDDITVPSHISNLLVTLVRPHETYSLPDLSVATLQSNDEGVAFIVSIDKETFFHAGDLNWWHWKGESEAFNTAIAASYQTEINLLKNTKISAAFLPVDPRLEENALLALDYLLHNVSVKNVFPIHFWGDFSVCTKAKSDPKIALFQKKIMKISHNGQTFLFDS